MSDHASPLPPGACKSPTPPAGFGRRLWIAGLLGNLHDAGFAIDTCVAGQDIESLFTAQLTRQQVLQCLRVMIDSVADLPAEVKADLPGIDWPAFARLKPHLAARGRQEQEELWSAMTTLVPVTLRALARYRKFRRDLFSFGG